MADPFDVNAARAAGYTDPEIADYLKSTGRNPAPHFWYAAKPPNLLEDSTNEPGEIVRDRQGNPIAVYKSPQASPPRFEDPFEAGANQVARGVKQLWAPSGTTANDPRFWDQKAAAASDVIRGATPFAAMAGLPALAAGAVPLVPTLTGLVGGTAAQQGTEYLANRAGVSPARARLVGDVAGVVGGSMAGAAAHAVTPEDLAAAGRFGRTFLQSELGEQFPSERLPGPFAPDYMPAPGQSGPELRALQRQVLTPQELERASAFKQDVPGFRTAAGYMTPGELQATIAQGPTVRKVTNLLDVLPKASQIAATAKVGMPKRGWYRASTQALLDVFGLEDAPRFASLLAAMSPQTSVESNLNNALRTWANWSRAGRPTDPAAIRAIMGQSVQGSGTEASVLEAWAQNAERALSGRDPRLVTLSGPKVNSFYRNLMDDVYAVTNDTWIANGMGVTQGLFGGTGTEAGLPRGNPGFSPGYIAASARQRQAGDLIGMQPREVQETYWSAVMALYEKARKLGMSPQELLDRGLLTTEDIRGTPDFSTLLRQDPYAGILEQAGYGSRLGQLQPHQFPGPVELTPAEQRGWDRTAATLGELAELRGRESRSATIPVSGTRPESVFAYATPEYGSRMAGGFQDLQDRDVLQAALGLPTITTRKTTTAGRPPGEVLGVPGSRQPIATGGGYAAGVEVPVTRRGALDIPQSVQERLNAAEAARGAMAGMDRPSWIAAIPDVEGADIAIPPARDVKGKPRIKAGEEEMGLATHLVGPEANLTDVGRAVYAVGKEALGDQDQKMLANLLGAGKSYRAKTIRGAIDYAADWAQQPGSGAVTRKMFEHIDKLAPADQNRLSKAMQDAAGDALAAWQSAAKARKEPMRADVMQFLSFLRDKGLPGVRSALQRGGVLPAVVLALLTRDAEKKD